jgi:cellulose synthase/poly-beta-1,6-N-acetylglucosamine synthase-like glycosyltransferase
MSNKRVSSAGSQAAKPAISVVIPHREGEGIEATLQALAQAAVLARAPVAGLAGVAPRHKSLYEVLSVSGSQPSVQRNHAVREAQGEYIYFLDNDSIPAGDCFLRILHFFGEHPDAAIFGGPSLTPASDTSWQQAFGVVLGNFFGTAFMRARYNSFGKLRATSDRELILCNLAARRSVFLDLGGFDERLYPNEENALMDLIGKNDWKLWHDPAFTVERSQRPHLGAFIRQLFGYGRGRGEQMRLAPAMGNLVPFVFMLFPLGALFLPLILLYVPYAAYAAGLYPALMLFAAFSAWRKGGVVILYSWIAFFFCHFCYGCGLWVGLFAPLRSRKAAVRVLLKRHGYGKQ